MSFTLHRLLLIGLFGAFTPCCWLWGQKPELSVPGHNLFVNQINVAQARFPQFNGEGIAVSVKEFRFDSNDVDFLNRYRSMGTATAQLSTHASIMATLIGGAGNGTRSGRGVAPAVWLSSSGFNGLMPDDPSDYASLDITIQNHAYGNAIDYTYSANAAAYDQSMHQQPRLLHVFSAGNDGLEAAPNSPYAQLNGWANLTGSYKMAKNCLLVGAVDSFLQAYPFSSAGPAYDGRIKPELVAFGQDGSSGAAALVSGAAAVLRQALPWDAPAHLVKALLIAGARDLGPEGPDFKTGFGNLNLQRSLELVQSAHFRSDTLNGPGTWETTFAIPPQTACLTATLCWNDPPQSPGAAKALINDLQLSLQLPNGEQRLPLTPNPFPLPDSLRLAARESIDTLNVVEQVRIHTPPEGACTLRLQASSLLGRQPFSVVFRTDAMDRLDWYYPVKGDPVWSGTSVVLRWETAAGLPPATGRLWWKKADQPDWRPLDMQVPAHRGWYQWSVPDSQGLFLLAMEWNGLLRPSDTFLITQPLSVKTALDCPDSTLLYWNQAIPGGAYELWALGSRHLEPVRILSDTFIHFSKTELPQQRFAVRPLLNGIAGALSDAPNPSEQGAGCYLDQFVAILNQEAAQVELRLSISTSMGVKNVFFEKWENGVFVKKDELPALGETFEWTDLFPESGLNTYRAGVTLGSGEQRFSNPENVLFWQERHPLFLPNPVRAGASVIAIVKKLNDNALWTLSDASGRILQAGQTDAHEISMQAPQIPGAYFWTLRSARENSSGVLIVVP